MGADKRSFPPFRKEKIPQSHSPIEEALYGNERAPSTDTQVCYYNDPGPIRPDRIAIYMQ